MKKYQRYLKRLKENVIVQNQKHPLEILYIILNTQKKYLKNKGGYDLVKDSKNSKAILEAYRKGYRVTKDGKVYGLLGKPLSLDTMTTGYKRFSCRVNGIRCSIEVHKLQAYQKFGDKLFLDGIQVRHLNGVQIDNSYDNISIGTSSENAMDKNKEVRIRCAKIAAEKVKIFSDDDIRNIRAMKIKGYTLKEIGSQYNIGKGHVSYIVNRKIYKDVN